MPILAAAAVPHPPLIIPEVGGRERRAIQKTVQSYEAAMALLAAQKPHTAVVISPHSPLYADYFCISPGLGARGSFAKFGASGVQLSTQYDEALAAAIAAEAEAAGIPAGFLGRQEAELDHATLVPLWFLNRVYPGYQTVRIGLSGFSPAIHYHFGRCIAKAAGTQRVVLIASGDLSHYLAKEGPYGYRPEGPELDRQMTAALANGDFAALLKMDERLAQRGGECGLRSFWILAGVFDGLALQAELLSYEGPFGVGYAVATFLPKNADETRRFCERSPL